VPLVKLDLSEPDYSKRTARGKRRGSGPSAKYLQPLCNSVQHGVRSADSYPWLSKGDGSGPLTIFRDGAEWFWTPVLMCQNYHLVHHLYPNVPFYRLKRIWNARRTFHMSHDPAIVSAFGWRPAPPRAQS